LAVSVLHLSDMHLGARSLEAVEPALRDFVEALRPDLIVASGDLSHRGRRAQLERADALLRGFGLPLLAVPGNHDIPHSFPGRFTHPWREFERQWQTTRPVFRSQSLLVVGLNSACPWMHQAGRVARSQLESAVRLLRDAPAGLHRVVVLHHHLLSAPWRARKRPLAHRGRILARLAEAGAELILSGHIHQATASERHEFQTSNGATRALVVATAPGLDRPRPRRLGEARGFQVHELSESELRCETYLWSGGGWELAAERRFPRRSS
jgi:3',5'-cyclic AMP phosphodiesterase CpdA